MTKTKTKNRVRANARKSVRTANTNKMNRVMGKFIPAVYDLHVEYYPSNNEGVFHFDDCLPADLRRLEMGSGYCMLTGCRDFHYRGTKEQMVRVMQAICRSPYKVNEFFVYPDGDHFEEYNEKMIEQVAVREARKAKKKKAKR